MFYSLSCLIMTPICYFFTMFREWYIIRRKQLEEQHTRYRVYISEIKRLIGAYKRRSQMFKTARSPAQLRQHQSLQPLVFWADPAWS